MTLDDKPNQDACDNNAWEPIYVARQPVFDVDMHIWGYELLFRHSAESGVAMIEDGNVATSRVMVDGFGMAMEWLSAGQKVLINYPSDMLLQRAPRALPAELAVVEILETVRPEAPILDACLQLKAEGYVLALDDFVGDPGFEPLLELADIVKVDVLGLERKCIAGLLEELKRYSCHLLAEKVEDRASFEFYRELGFDLFQGFFFSRPKIIAGKKLSSNELSKLKLIEELSSPDLDLPRITRIIQADVSLSYRLLSYINSPGVGLTHKVNSITQAVLLLGRKKIAAWLRVLIMADLNPSPQARELLFFSLQRAGFLEILASLKITPLPPDSMFLLGLFSFLDTLLSQPMEEIVSRLSLEPRLAKALLGRDAELCFWLDTCRACEHGHWGQVEAGLSRFGIASSDTARILNRAVVWAKTFLNMT